MTTLKTISLGLFAALALLAAGCGGATSVGSGGSGATLINPNAIAFISVDSDLGSSQWKQVDTLAKKFPGRDLLLQKLGQEFTKNGVDFKNDVEPALGPEVDFAFVPGPTAKDVAVVGLTKPDDAGKFKDLVKKLNATDTSGQPTVYREVDGWYVISDTQAQIDQALKSGDKSLSDESAYNDALGTLPSDALAKAYVNGAQLAKLIREHGQGSGLTAAAPGLDKLDFVSAAVSAENDGLRVHGAVQGSGAGAFVGSGDYASKLIDEVPGDALAFLTFRSAQGIGSALGTAQAPLEYALGISVDELVQLFANETALYVRPGAVIPEITLLLQPKNTDTALATLDKLAARIARATGGTLKRGTQRTIDFGQIAVHYGAKDGKVVVTSAPGGVDQVGSSSEKLADSADFKEAKSAAGLPDSNGGYVYLDLKNAIPLIEGFAGISGQNLPPSVTENLRPLRSFLAWSAGSGNTRTFDLFLEIK
ncbi:MAG TPA: DUF3352 domain-containing protein [Gaiellaceae bacterium]